jgi:hypothetical protein
MRFILCFSLYTSLLISCVNNSKTNSAIQYDKDVIDSYLNSGDSINNIPAIQERVQKIQTALGMVTPVLRLTDSMNANQLAAQEVALADALFTKFIYDTIQKKPFRNEVFNAFPCRESDMAGIKTITPIQQLVRVEMYNFALNLTSMAIVDVPQKKLLLVNHYPQTQPDIPAHLKKLALQIATQAPEVHKALGYTPKETEALMANTQTALNKTKCERSRHLCVAPTFVKGDKALWAIVDLTEHKLVGVRWTNVGNTGPAAFISERRLQDDKVTACYCEKVTNLNKDGWQLDYMLTSSDGLRISDVQFNGKKILTSAKLVDWHVSYSGTEGMGYSDAVGCPYFSQSAVVATSIPKIAAIKNNNNTTGFVLEQAYASQGWPTACNYNYVQRFEFYKDGSFRVSCASLGRGCSVDGTYRPVFRIAFAENNNTIYEWANNNWDMWKQEKWTQQTDRTTYDANGALLKIASNTGGFTIQPGKGQFADGGRGDNAYIYATLNKPNGDEGEADLPTIGPCCNTDYHQGPEKFMEGNAENIESKSIVLWYVAQLKNDNTKGKEYCWAESVLENGIYVTKAYPCFCGPLFTPIK